MRERMGEGESQKSERVRSRGGKGTNLVEGGERNRIGRPGSSELNSRVGSVSDDVGGLLMRERSRSAGIKKERRGEEKESTNLV